MPKLGYSIGENKTSESPVIKDRYKIRPKMKVNKQGSPYPFHANTSNPKVYIDRARKKYGQNKLWDGNCGQFAWALAHALGKDSCDIAMLCQDETDESELFYGEPRIYHVMVGYKGKLWDGQGECSNDYLLDFAEEEYSDYTPIIVTGLDIKDKKVFTAMNANTDWSIAWQDFYKVMKEAK